MNKTLFKVINPIVKGILRSSLHGLMSHNTVLIEFLGRKSRESYSTPISYHENDGRMRCFTSKENKWWRNLVDTDTVQLVLRGQHITAKPSVSMGGSAIENALRDFLIASPRDARYSGVSFDSAGQPNASDLQIASEKLVMISMEIAKT
ncbi:MAG: hypothetical protein AAF542_17040 [Pseudomonadota bacterium]